jgi:hypothetical protein
MEFVREWRNETNMSRFAIRQGLPNAKIAEMPPGNSPSPTRPVALSFLIFFGGVDQGSHRQTIASTTQRTAHDAGSRREINAKRA